MVTETLLALPPAVRIVAAVPAAGLLLGSGLGIVAPNLPAVVPAVALGACVFLMIAALVHARAWMVGVLVLLGCVPAGVLLSQRAWQDAWRPSLRVAFESIAHDERLSREAEGTNPPEDDRARVVLEGVIREDAAITDRGAVSLRVGVRWIGRASSGAHDPAANPVHGDVLLTVAGALAVERSDLWRRGRVIRTAALLRRPGRYLDPGVLDQERALARRGVSLVGSVKSGALIEAVARGEPLDEAAAWVRKFVRRAIHTAVGRWSDRGAAIVVAILIGDRSGLDPHLQRRLQEAGIYHVIAISGGNIAILAGIALAFFRLAGLLGRGAMVTAMVGLVGYSFVVSGGASVDRATLMAVVYFAGRALDLRGPPLNALALVAGLLVAADPLVVSDPGFLLTFGATAGLILVAFGRGPGVESGWPRTVIALGLASVAAEAVLFPVSAVFFSQVTVAGLALNFIAIPAMAVTQVAGLAVLALSLVSSVAATGVGAVAAAGAEALVQSTTVLDWLPFLSWRVAAPSLPCLTLYYGSAGTWWVLRSRRDRVSGSHETIAAATTRQGTGWLAVGIGMWILVAPWTFWASRGDGRLHITFLDVGQGDATLVRFPSGKAMLVDAGGNPSASAFDIGDRVVGNALRTLGVRRLDTVVLTHGDADHVGGAGAVLRDFRPRDVWEGVPVPPSLPLAELRAEAHRIGARWIRLQRGAEFFVDDVRLIVRHPTLPDWERLRVRNDDSIVIELQWRDVSIVLTGDIGVDVEAALVPDIDPMPLRIVKVPHHGSVTSSSDPFVRTLGPTIAVVSVGRSNTFGHPAPSVIRRYEAVGTRLLRTDRDGAISVATDGHTLDVHTFTGRRLSVSGAAAVKEATNTSR